LAKHVLGAEGTGVDVKGGRRGSNRNSPVELELTFLGRCGGSQRQQRKKR
jgi:hypothetical protein